MRRLFIGLAFAACVVGAPVWAQAGDQEIAQQVMQKLDEQKQAGQLKGFRIGVSVKDGVVWLKGRTATEAQREQVVELARRIPGVTGVYPELEVSAAPAPAASSPASGGFGGLFGLSATPAASSGTPTVTNASSRRVTREPAPTAEASPEPTTTVVNGAETTGGPQLVMNPLASQPYMSHMMERDSEPAVSVHALPAQSSYMHHPVATAEYGLQSSAQANQPIPAEIPGGGARFTSNQQPVQPQSARAAQAYAAPPVQAAPQHHAAAPVRVASVHGNPRPVPMAYAPARQVNYQPGAPGLGQPIPAYHPGQAPGIAPARYDHPRMPGYAWPSYAAYPNYAAVTYPRQYSPTAWPYIGPFYPYPQVPLGWRKVTLEWDDGWWMLDFKSK